MEQKMRQGPGSMEYVLESEVVKKPKRLDARARGDEELQVRGVWVSETLRSRTMEQEHGSVCAEMPGAGSGRVSRRLTTTYLALVIQPCAGEREREREREKERRRSRITSI